MTSQPARNSTTRWRETDARHHLHPFTDYKDLSNTGGSRIITKAAGVWLEDSEGNRLLDGMAGLWCVNVGYGREELAEVAHQQMLELPYYNTFFKTATPPPIELSEKLVQLTPEGLNHIFYASSGSEANDTVVRTVRRFWKLSGQPSRKTVISRVNAYHGSTLAGASLGGMKAMHEIDDLPLPDFVHIRQPYWYREGGDLSPEAFGQQAAQALEDRILELGADKVAAFIGEPIQGSGGVIVPPDSYWPEIQRICRKYDILLVVDEVICGFGRTGQWFGSFHFGIEPDIMSMAKGLSSGYLPLSAVAVNDRVAKVLTEKGGEFAHGFTYSGHPVCCAVAAANIAIIEREGLVERVREETGPYLQARLREMTDHPLVGDARGIGLIGAVELVADKAARKSFPAGRKVGIACRDLCMKNGVISRAVGDSMVVSPPLIITKAEIDQLVAGMRKSIDQTGEALDLL